MNILKKLFCKSAEIKRLKEENQKLKKQLCETIRFFRPGETTDIREIEGYFGDKHLVCGTCGKYIVDTEDLNCCQKCGRVVRRVHFLPDSHESRGATLEAQYCNYTNKNILS